MLRTVQAPLLELDRGIDCIIESTQVLSHHVVVYSALLQPDAALHCSCCCCSSTSLQQRAVTPEANHLKWVTDPRNAKLVTDPKDTIHS